VPVNVWHEKVDLTPEIEAYKLGVLTIPELAVKVTEIIKASKWRQFTPYPDTFDDHLGRLLQAETEGEYEAAFEYIYDLADQDRVWIQTF